MALAVVLLVSRGGNTVIAVADAAAVAGAAAFAVGDTVARAAFVRFPRAC